MSESNLLYINTLYFVEKIDLYLPNLKAEPGISILEGRKMWYVVCFVVIGVKEGKGNLAKLELSNHQRSEDYKPGQNISNT